LNYFSEKEGFLIERVEYNTKLPLFLASVNKIKNNTNKQLKQRKFILKLDKERR